MWGFGIILYWCRSSFHISIAVHESKWYINPISENFSLPKQSSIPGKILWTSSGIRERDLTEYVCKITAENGHWKPFFLSLSVGIPDWGLSELQFLDEDVDIYDGVLFIFLRLSCCGTGTADPDWVRCRLSEGPYIYDEMLYSDSCYNKWYTITWLYKYSIWYICLATADIPLRFNDIAPFLYPTELSDEIMDLYNCHYFNFSASCC